MSATGKVIFAPLVKMSFVSEHRENFNSHFWENILCVKNGLNSMKIGYTGTFQFDFWEVNMIFGKDFPNFEKVFGSFD